MSEIEYRLNIYSTDREKTTKIEAAFYEIQKSSYQSAAVILQEFKLKKSKDLSGIMNVSIKKRLHDLSVSFDTAVHDESGSDVIDVIRKVTDAVLVKEYNNQVGKYSCYGFVKGRKRKFAGMIKGLAEIDPNYALHEAVKRGKTNEIKSLLKSGNVDVNFPHETPLTLLAVEEERVKALELVLEAGIDPDLATEVTGQTFLLEAAKKNDQKYMELAVRYGADLNKANLQGITPLMKACEYSKNENIRILLDAGADLEARDLEGKTALMHGCSATLSREPKRLKIVQLLLDRSADVQAVDSSGNPVTHYANSAKSERLLFEKGAKPYIPEREYSSLPEKDLFVAIRYNHIEKVRELLEQWESLNENNILHNKLFLDASISYDRPEIFCLLISQENSLEWQDERGNTLLHKAAGESLEIVRILIDWGLDIHCLNNKNQTPLHSSAKHGDNPEIIDYLLGIGADLAALDNKGETPLDKALWVLNDNKEECLNIFLRHNALERLTDISALLEKCVEYKWHELLEEILQKKKKNVDFFNLFFKSIQEKNFTTFEILFENGADINTVFDHSGASLFSYVCERLVRSWGDEKAALEKMYRMFIDREVEVDIPDKSNITPLFYFQSQKGFVAETKELLARGADINRQANDMAEMMRTYFEEGVGVSPLMLAASKGLTQNVELLLESNADVTLKNGEGNTARDLAEARRKKKVANMIRTYERAAV